MVFAGGAKGVTDAGGGRVAGGVVLEGADYCVVECVGGPAGGVVCPVVAKGGARADGGEVA